MTFVSQIKNRMSHPSIFVMSAQKTREILNFQGVATQFIHPIHPLLEVKPTISTPSCTTTPSGIAFQPPPVPVRRMGPMADIIEV